MTLLLAYFAKKTLFASNFRVKHAIFSKFCLHVNALINFMDYFDVVFLRAPNQS